MRGAVEPWNAMATWPSFLPLMQQLVQATLVDSASSYNLTVGQPILGSQKAVGERSTIRIVRPDGNEIELQASEIDENGIRSWAYGSTKSRGVYNVSLDGNPPRPYAMNINPVQSDLRAIDFEQLPKSTEKSPSPVAIDAENRLANPSNTLVRWLLGALVVMLAAESCLAWTLGRRLG